MDLIEAVDSGKPFRRINWIAGPWVKPHGTGLFLSDSKKPFIPSTMDIQANDYILQPDEATASKIEESEYKYLVVEAIGAVNKKNNGVTSEVKVSVYTEDEFGEFLAGDEEEGTHTLILNWDGKNSYPLSDKQCKTLLKQ